MGLHQVRGARKRSAILVAGWAATCLVALSSVGCSAGTPAQEPTPATGTPVSLVTPVPGLPAPALPPTPTPGEAANCPYLSNREVADLNGQLVAETRLDTTYAPPACFFLIGDRSVQLSVWVLRSSWPMQATALVDRAAPIATSDPAAAPPGWTGGRRGGPAGAVYAVAKGPVSVVVTTNQAQSVKAQRVAERVIAVLALS